MTNQKAIEILQAQKHIDSDVGIEAVSIAVHALETNMILQNALYKRCRYNGAAGPIGKKDGKCIGFSRFFSKDAKNNLCITCPIYAKEREEWHPNYETENDSRENR